MNRDFGLSNKSKLVNEHFPSRLSFLHSLMSPLNSVRPKANDENRKTFPKQREHSIYGEPNSKRDSGVQMWMKFEFRLLFAFTVDSTQIELFALTFRASSSIVHLTAVVESINQRRWSNCSRLLIEFAETRPQISVFVTRASDRKLASWRHVWLRFESIDAVVKRRERFPMRGSSRFGALRSLRLKQSNSIFVRWCFEANESAQMRFERFLF